MPVPAAIAIDVILNPGRSRRGPRARIDEAVAAAATRAANRRAYEELLLADDHVLEDICVSRADVRKALRDCGRW